MGIVLSAISGARQYLVLYLGAESAGFWGWSPPVTGIGPPSVAVYRGAHPVEVGKGAPFFLLSVGVRRLASPSPSASCSPQGAKTASLRVRHTPACVAVARDPPSRFSEASRSACWDSQGDLTDR